MSSSVRLEEKLTYMLEFELLESRMGIVYLKVVPSIWYSAFSDEITFGLSPPGNENPITTFSSF